MPDKFIPNDYKGFARRAEEFAQKLVADPQRWFVEPRDAELLMRRVQACLAVHDKPAASASEKKESRQQVERLMRKLANQIRPDERICIGDKIALYIKPRKQKPTKQRCPRRAPQLDFVGFANENSQNARRHVLRFKDVLGAGAAASTPVMFTNRPLFSRSRAKPAGAVRLELFFDWVAEGQEIPKHPAGLSGWPRYLRSYTRTPIVVEFPMPPTPMLIVYWARWADSRGNVGPFSRPVVAGWEGRAQVAGMIAGGSAMLPRQQKVIIMSPRRELPQEVESIEGIEARDHEMALLE